MSFTPDVRLATPRRHKFGAYLLVCQRFNEIVDKLQSLLTEEEAFELPEIKRRFNRNLQAFFTDVLEPVNLENAVDALLIFLRLMPEHVRPKSPQAALLLERMINDSAALAHGQPSWNFADALGKIHELSHQLAQRFFQHLPLTTPGVLGHCALKLDLAKGLLISPASYQRGEITLRFPFEDSERLIEWFELLPFAITHEYVSHHEAHWSQVDAFSEGWMVTALISHLDAERREAVDSGQPARRLSHQQARACHTITMETVANGWADDTRCLLGCMRDAEAEGLFWRVTDYFRSLSPSASEDEAVEMADRLGKFMRKIRDDISMGHTTAIRAAVLAAHQVPEAEAANAFIAEILVF